MSEKRTLKTAETIRVAGLVILMIMISGPAGILTAESMADVTMNTARLRVISSTEARAMLERESGMVLLDVRTSGEFMAGRIPGAINIDLTRADFYAKIDRLDRNARYIVYCRTKNRSKVAVDYMMKKGFMNIWHMTDGWVGWNGKGLPVEK
jgi:rhodanese-related sulfurtransferase